MPAYKKISELTTAGTLDGTELVEIVQSGNSRQAPVAGLAVNAGFILPFGGATAPAGFLACDGAAVSRTTYATLFAAISTTWGVGDGSTTFNLPDLEGAFLRGTGTGTINARDKAGPAVGAFQEDQMQKITGTANGYLGLFSSSGHAGALDATTSDAAATGSPVAGQRRVLTLDSANSPDARASATTDGETRPYAAGILYCIKT